MKKETQFLIIGLGLLGGSYAKGLSEAGFSVMAVDPNLESLKYAEKQHWINQYSIECNKEMVERANIIIFAVYPNLIVDLAKKISPWLSKGTLITDVTGVKSEIVNHIQSILSDEVEFVGAHPMAGKEVSGVQFSNNEIFKVANFILTPTSKNTQHGIDTIKEMAEILNFAHISILSVDEHDKMISFVSQLTHVIAVTLMNTNDNTHLVDYTGDSFRDLTRIAKINEELWTELFLMNKKNLLQDIEDFSNELNHFKEVLENENIDEMKRLFIQSTERRKYFDRKRIK